MVCNDIRERLDKVWDGDGAAEVRAHLDQCPACTRYYRDSRLVRAGLDLWKSEPAVVPSVGFAERLVRQLGEISRAPSVADFIERVGRRFVYATLVLTFLALLALALPETGPVRGLTSADIQINSQQAALSNSDPIGDAAWLGSPEGSAGESIVPPGSNEEQ